MVYVKSVINQIQMIIGVNHATPLDSETPFQHGRQKIKKLITLFKTLRFVHGIIIWYWNGIRGKYFQRLKKSEKVAMEPFFALKLN